MKTYDAIVIGVGGMGSAAAYHLARRGASVLALEQFECAHARGSSHGLTRLHRLAYFEAGSYVPLLQRADRLWDELSAQSGTALLHRVGLLVMGASTDTGAMSGILASSAKFGIPVETLSNGDLRERFGQFAPPAGFCGVLEPGAGFLLVESCVSAHWRLAADLKAEFLEHQKVVSWSANNQGVEVRTSTSIYRGRKLVITAGPWSGGVLSDLGLPLKVVRVPQFWFDVPAALSAENGTPCFAFDLEGEFTYGMPALPGMGLKLASYKPPERLVTDASTVDRKITVADAESFRFVRENCLPGISKEPLQASICLYTLTPDETFIVDRHPRYENVVFAAGFSGHGFKFATVMGEILAGLALEGRTEHPIDFLRLSRFGSY